MEKCGYHVFGYHKLSRMVENNKKMCINLSTVEKAQIKDFFEDMCKNTGEKVDSFTGIPQVIHKLSTKCG